MTEDGFRKYLKPYIEEGIPFSAYWHPKGWGLIKTGPLPTLRHEYILHVPGKPDKNYHTAYTRCANARNRTKGAWMESVPVEGKPRQVSPTVIKRWKRSIEQLRRDSWNKVVTVDFDGKHTSIEGGFEL